MLSSRQPSDKGEGLLKGQASPSVQMIEMITYPLVFFYEQGPIVVPQTSVTSSSLYSQQQQLQRHLGLREL